jgi:DNA helicase-2/ATP-dependent DNA helicase PcrA
MLDLSKLNRNQLAAVRADDGPVLIIAGAGTGKTRVLTARIAYLVEQRKFNPNQILAFTFTNKAANEMRTRISNTLEHAFIPWIGTYHATCLKILKEDIHHLKRANNFNVIDDEDQLTIIREIFKEGEISVKDIKPKKALEIIQKVKIDEIDLTKINSLQKLHELKIYRWEELSSFRHIVKNYEKKLIKSNLLDFDDLLILTRKLFNDHPTIKEK